MKVIDGSYGEGGGQILRTALALSAVTLEPVKIINIRAKRRNPGLARQHMTAVKALAELTDAEVEGLALGSRELVFKPRRIKAGRYRFDIGTAGSITLVLQALTPALVYAPGPVELEIRGGTDVSWSPTVDYFANVFLRFLERMGYRVELELLRRGHYPRGGGIVRVRVPAPPRRLAPLEVLERGEILRIRGRSHCVRLPRHVAERQAAAAERLLRSKLGDLDIRVEVEHYDPGRDPHLGPGSGVALWAETRHSLLGADSLGARGKPAEVVGREAAEKLLEDLSRGTALDRHMSDMIIPFLAMADGVSTVTGARYSLHAYTNVWVVKQMLGVEIEVEGSLDEPFRLRVSGSPPSP